MISYPGAVKKSLRHICAQTNAKVQDETIQFPLQSEDDILTLVQSTLKPGTTLALFDHIPSNMAFVMPVKKLVQICHDK